MGELTIADTPEALTTDWLTDALRASGHLTGGRVAEATLRPLGTGQMCDSVRVTLRYEGAEATAPETVVAKLPAADPTSRATAVSLRSYEKEVRFYQQLAPTLPMRTPTVYHADIEPVSASFVLLLEDLAPATPGDQATGLTGEEAEHAAVNLAGLHGPRWSDPSLLEIPWLSRHTPETAEFYGQILAGAIPTFLERFEGWMAPEDPDTLRSVPEHLGAWLLARPDRFAVIHGDYRPDNLMFPKHGAGVSAVDWQTLAVGLPGRDIGYLLATSLDPEVRRAEERRIVEAYRAALAEHGVELSAEECFDDYRLGVVQGPLITVLGAVYATDPNPSSDAMFTAMITRSLQAIRDLDPFSLL